MISRLLIIVLIFCVAGASAALAGWPFLRHGGGIVISYLTNDAGTQILTDDAGTNRLLAP